MRPSHEETLAAAYPPSLPSTLNGVKLAHTTGHLSLPSA